MAKFRADRAKRAAAGAAQGGDSGVEGARARRPPYAKSLAAAYVVTTAVVI